jgi:hypothetical protein
MSISGEMVNLIRKLESMSGVNFSDRHLEITTGNEEKTE